MTEPPEPYPEDNICVACEKAYDDLEYYDNGIWGWSGWMCDECIGNAEMEL